MIRFCQKIVSFKWFNYSIIFLIIANALILGAETYPFVSENYGTITSEITFYILVLFVIEAIIKITAVAPNFKRYFGNGWDLFDFFIVVFSVLPLLGHYAMVARIMRVFRILRLITVIPDLRLVTASLIRSLPGLGNVILLISVVFYVYAIIGFYLFRDHDPFHWQSLGMALITLFRVLTFDDWTDIMYNAMQVYEFAWFYFISFAVVTAFIVINMFIAILISNLGRLQKEEERSQQIPEEKSEVSEMIFIELRRINSSLTKINAAIGVSQEKSKDPPNKEE